VRALNRKYRGLDRATDVLSFPAAPDPREATPARTRSPLIAPGVSDPPDRLRPGLRRVRRRVAKAEGRLRSSHPIAPDRTRSHPARQDPFLGDVVIARGVAARQARTAGHPERTEWRVLALHGLLHLLGYDHECDGGEMRRVERRLRRKGGLGAGLIEREGAR
jgi:rRNA maturation RNase YbeY